MTKRLTEKQKEEIVKNFKYGVAIDVLSQKYNCTKSTIIRNLKKNLGELKYKEYLNKSKTFVQKSRTNRNQTNDFKKSDFDGDDLRKDSNNPDVLNENITASDFAPIDSFFEIAPLDYEIENLPRKELSSVPISEIDFPKIVYMIVDNKIELEIKFLRDFPDWQFLSQNDLNRKTIEIYFDLKTAKKFCTRDQKVIKVPNTDVFKIVAPILVSRGISRIVCPDKLISL